MNSVVVCNMQQDPGPRRPRRRKQAKPLASGFKTVVWTIPPPVDLPSTRPGIRQQRPRPPRVSRSLSTANPYYREEVDYRRPKNDDVWPSGGDGSSSFSASASSLAACHEAELAATAAAAAATLPEVAPPQQPRPKGPIASGEEDDQQAGCREPAQICTPAAPVRSKSEDFRAREKRQASAPARLTPVKACDPRASSRALQRLPPPAALEGTGLDISMSQSTPMPSRRPSTTTDGADRGVIMVERSLSDSSVVTASSGGPKSHKPIILTDVSDQDAIAGLVALLGKGKGLPVVKHATGLGGGGKSRKLLKLDEAAGLIYVCGTLPPYFKTKIPMQDVDRVDAKWCCVVIHAKARSPVSGFVSRGRCLGSRVP